MLKGEAKRDYMRSYMQSYRKTHVKVSKTPCKTHENAGVRPLDPTPASLDPKPTSIIEPETSAPLWNRRVHKSGDTVRKYNDLLRCYEIVTL
jgi:hypothetical protein